MITQPAATEKPVSVQLITGHTIDAVRIAPGEYLPVLPKHQEIPLCGYITYVSAGDGKFVPRVRVWEQYVKLVEETPENLGLGKIDVKTLLRLGVAGFFKIRRLTPRVTMICVPSLLAHIDATSDPDFWTPDRIRRYSAACYIIK